MAGAAHRLDGDGSEYQDHSPVVECPHSLIQALRASVLDSFNSAPHGGAEVYGVLFGTHSGDEVHIAVFRPVVFESAMAGSTPLTEEQRAAFAKAMAEPGSGSDGNALEAVGWFRSHPRSEVSLSQRDLEIASTFFARPQHVVMIVRPGNSVPTHVRFYFRESDDALTAGSPFREFTVPLAREIQPPFDFARLDSDANPGVHRAIELPPPESSTQLEPSREANGLFLPPAPVAKRRISSTWPLVLAMVASVVTMLYWLNRPPQRLALRVFDTAGQMRILWEPTQQRAMAHLEIDDGGAKLWIELQPDQLRSGNYTYSRHSGNVTVRMVMQRQGAAALSEMASFFGAGGQAVDALSARSTPAGSSVSRDRLMPSSSLANIPEKPAELVISVPVERARPVPKFKAPAAAASRAAAVEKLPAPELAPPPVLAHDTPSAVLGPPVRVEPPVQKPAEPAPAPSANAAQAMNTSTVTPRTPAAPASGRIIWIGRLQKNQPVAIDGKTCSTGTIIGVLPGRPVKFTVSPGDLSSDGIVLYTANPQYANSVVESPGAHNGWNKTVYTWNTKYANDVAVEEAPAPQNRWNRLVLRSRNSKISVVVIDWSLVP